VDDRFDGQAAQATHAQHVATTQGDPEADQKHLRYREHHQDGERVRSQPDADHADCAIKLPDRQRQKRQSGDAVEQVTRHEPTEPDGPQ
jgi:hypothetical protein